MVLDLLELARPSEQVLLLAADFKDAFKMLTTSARERRYLRGRARCQGRQGWFVYARVLFG
eukprot:8580907-Alexandrium_andersonii.AAC.1